MKKRKKESALTIFTEVFFSLCGIYGIYMMYCALKSIWGERVLKKHGCRVYDDVTVIDAEPETLEFCIRAALAEGNLFRKDIVVNIRMDSRDSEEMLYIAGAFSQRHGNIRINLT